MRAAARSLGVPADQADAMPASVLGNVLGSYNNQETQTPMERDLAAYGYTDPSQPGYAETARQWVAWNAGKPVTGADGRAAVATQTYTPADQYGQPPAQTDVPDTLPPDFNGWDAAPPQVSTGPGQILSPDEFTALVNRVGPMAAQSQLRSGAISIRGR
jgi:hypothetical protein